MMQSYVYIPECKRTQANSEWHRTDMPKPTANIIYSLHCQLFYCAATFA